MTLVEHHNTTKDRVLFFDTTLRDGEQTKGVAFDANDKVDIALQLQTMRVPIIKAGFPASGPWAINAVARVAERVRQPIIAILARATIGDIDTAWEAVKNAESSRIHVFLSTSDIHLMHQLRKNREEVMEMAVNGVRYARRFCPDVEFSPMDATRSEPAYLYALLEQVILAGATTINIPDTVGIARTRQFGNLIQDIIANVPSIHKAILSVHCHDDKGLAVANSLEGILAGARQVEVCVNGLGERAGNAALEEVAMDLFSDSDSDYYGVYTGLDTTKIISLSTLVAEHSGITPQPNKSIVGANAFVHKSGIHQDAVIKNSETFEIWKRSQVGLSDSDGIVFGTGASANAVLRRLRELGYDPTREEARKASLWIADQALETKREITDDDIRSFMKGGE